MSFAINLMLAVMAANGLWKTARQWRMYGILQNMTGYYGLQHAMAYYQKKMRGYLRYGAAVKLII
jgi:hypothetical protein